MGKLTRIGMDTSKYVFQLHGVDEEERPTLRRKLRRHDLHRFFGSLPRLRIGMEACGASHHWARELQALGHEVALIPPQYTKPYVDRGKNDAADAEAICETLILDCRCGSETPEAVTMWSSVFLLATDEFKHFFSQTEAWASFTLWAAAVMSQIA